MPPDHRGLVQDDTLAATWAVLVDQHGALLEDGAIQCVGGGYEATSLRSNYGM